LLKRLGKLEEASADCNYKVVTISGDESKSEAYARVGVVEGDKVIVVQYVAPK